MVTDTNDKKTVVAAGTPVAVVGEPVKKRGSTKATRRAQDVEKRMTKTMSRLSRAVDKGVSKYIDRRDKSDNKRKDGGLIDGPQNIVRSAARAAADVTPMIGDLMKLVSTKESRKALRRNFSSVPTIPFM